MPATQRCYSESEQADVQALADMVAQFLAPLATQPIPRPALESLAADLVAHNGDDGFEVRSAIEAHVGPYLDA